MIRDNEVYELAKFNLLKEWKEFEGVRKELPGETVNQFSTALFALAEHCNFAALKSNLIRDRFVVALQDKVVLNLCNCMQR